MKKKIFLATCIGVCALLLAACGKEKNFSAGVEMSGEEAEAYREKLLSEQDTPPVSEPENEEQGDELPKTCYYTATGTVWHAAKECSYLKNADDILEGSPEGAAVAGKSRPCSRCAALYTGE